MSLRLTLITASSTAATAAAAFPLDDEPLDARGAAWVARAAPLVGRHDTAVTGPSAACRHTACGLGLAARVEPRLRDRDHGCWTGKRLDEVAGADPEGVAAWTSDPRAAPHGGESLTDLLDRTAEWLAGLPVEGSLVAVVPVAVVRAAVVHVSGAPAMAWWRYEPAPLSMTVLRGSPLRWAVRVVGSPLIDRNATQVGAGP